MSLENIFWDFEVGARLRKQDLGITAPDGSSLTATGTVYEVERRLYDADDDLRLYYLKYVDESGHYLASADMVERDWERIDGGEVGR